MQTLTLDNLNLFNKITKRLEEGNCSALEQLIAAGIIHRYGFLLENLIKGIGDESKGIEPPGIITADLIEFNKLLIQSDENNYKSILALRKLVQDFNKECKSQMEMFNRKVGN